MSTYQNDFELGENVTKMSTADGSTTTAKNGLRYYLFVLPVVALVIILGAVGYMTNTRSSSSPLSMKSTTSSKIARDSSDSYNEYKYTTSIAAGSYEEVYDYANKYIAVMTDPINLGCDSTMKLVSTTLNDFELHWVDSSSFTQSGRTITEWTDYISSLGTDTFNSFMHNKIQMYVPTLQSHYNMLKADKAKIMLRKSSSSGSTTEDVGHISMFLPHSGTVFEMVGPISSLTDDAQTEFLSWSSYECPEAHTLSQPLDYYSDVYASTDYNDAQSLWSSGQGLPTPLKVQITMPTGSLSNVANTIDLAQSFSGATVTTYTSTENSCSLAIIENEQDVGVTSRIVYVQNDNDEANSGDLTVSDWETEAEKSHVDLLDDNGWDRYLDTHVAYSLTSETSCEDSFTRVSELLASNDGAFKYSIRVTTSTGEGTHFYIGTEGIRTWEFNLYNCTISSYPDICGCTSTNNDYVYYAENSVYCSV